MNIEIPNDHLIFFCGGNAGSAAAVNMGKIVKEYLYGRQNNILEREAVLGRFLLKFLMAEIDK